jgi:methionyl-tRNA formyltransferase
MVSSLDQDSLTSAEFATDAPRIVFMGTPDFAVPSLNALAAVGLKPIAVATGSDKKRGRGQKVSSTPVKLAADALGIDTILQPESVKDPSFAQNVRQLNPDIIVVVAFRILPPEVFEAARLGTFNLHGSLLPRYRGAAPINHAIMQGDTETGVTTFFLKQLVDTGNVILKRRLSIGPNETAGDVHDRMMILGADAVVETVQRIIRGDLTTTPQDDTQATPAPKIFRKDCELDFSGSASEVHNQIRGLSPWPGAFTFLNGKQLKVFRSEVHDSSSTTAEPGRLTKEDGALLVSCGTGCLRLTEVQIEGKRRVTATDFLNGVLIEDGQMVGR